MSERKTLSFPGESLQALVVNTMLGRRDHGVCPAERRLCSLANWYVARWTFMSLVEVHRQQSPCQEQVRETMLQDLVYSSWDIQSQPRFRARLSLTQPTRDLLIFLTCEVEIMKFTEAAVGKVSIEKSILQINSASQKNAHASVCVCVCLLVHVHTCSSAFWFVVFYFRIYNSFSSGTNINMDLIQRKAWVSNILPFCFVFTFSLFKS